MKDLDDIQAIEKIDKSGMYKLLLGFPQQCKKAMELAQKHQLPDSFHEARNIVISGMGGSAIGGDLLRSLFIDKCHIPININRNYFIPAYVDKETLFIAASYSGNTEETISAMRSAQKKNANIIAISSGGAIESIAAESGIPHFSVPEKNIQPRCAFGYLFIPMVIFLSKLGFITDQTSNIQDSIELLSKTQDEYARQLAISLQNRLPIIYASQSYYDVIAMRWKGQFNENSKTMAFYNVIPEMNHNEIVGWGIPKDITQRCTVIILTDNEDFEKIRKRMDITRMLIASEGAKVIDVEAKGSSPLGKALYFLHIGDLASYYLAILNDIDPTPVDRIAILKRKLDE